MELLTKEDLSTILVFQKINADWVREVHGFTSMRKKKKHHVIFRNSNNRKLESLHELKNEGFPVDETNFRSALEHSIVSNKVGANKMARKAARAWMEDPQRGKQAAENKQAAETGSMENSGSKKAKSIKANEEYRTTTKRKAEAGIAATIISEEVAKATVSAAEAESKRNAAEKANVAAKVRADAEAKAAVMAEEKAASVKAAKAAAETKAAKESESKRQAAKKANIAAKEEARLKAEAAALAEAAAFAEAKALAEAESKAAAASIVEKGEYMTKLASQKDALLSDAFEEFSLKEKDNEKDMEKAAKDKILTAGLPEDWMAGDVGSMDSEDEELSEQDSRNEELSEEEKCQKKSDVSTAHKTISAPKCAQESQTTAAVEAQTFAAAAATPAAAPAPTLKAASKPAVAPAPAPQTAPSPAATPAASLALPTTDVTDDWMADDFGSMESEDEQLSVDDSSDEGEGKYPEMEKIDIPETESGENVKESGPSPNISEEKRALTIPLKSLSVDPFNFEDQILFKFGGQEAENEVSDPYDFSDKTLFQFGGQHSAAHNESGTKTSGEYERVSLTQSSHDINANEISGCQKENKHEQEELKEGLSISAAPVTEPPAPAPAPALVLDQAQPNGHATGLTLPINEVTDDWMADDLGSMNSDDEDLSDEDTEST